MSTRPLAVRRPRSLRVLLGGLVAFFGLIVGASLALLCSQQLTMRDVPDEMTVAQLVDRGIDQNRLVKLSGVQLAAFPNANGLFGGQPGHSLDGQGNVVIRIADDTHAASLRDQIRHSGAVVGHVGREELVHDAVDVFRKYEIDLSGVPQLDGMRARADYPYVVRSVDVSDEPFVNREQNLAMYLGGSLAVTSLGLILAGSGGAGIFFWITCLIPALLSLPGVLLRYGRGNAFTRAIYLAAGAALIGGAYFLTLHEGRIYSPQTNPWIASLAYVLACFGTAAVLGAIVNQIRGGQRATLAALGDQMDGVGGVRGADAKTSQRIRSAAQANGQAVAPGLSDEMPVIRYQDPQVMIAASNLIDEAMALTSTGFEALDFESPLVVDVGDGERDEVQTVQIGCRNMVLAVNAMTTDDPANPDQTNLRTRLFSVLQNGQVIVTLSKGTPVDADERKHSGGVIWLAATSDPARLLSGHLERTVRAAESMASTLLGIHPGEWRDVHAYAHRVMADIGHQNGDNGYKVFPSQHGRFRFPVQQVAELEQLTVGS